MNRAELAAASERFIREQLAQCLPPGTPVYLFGSRARGEARWNSDYDLWIDAELPDSTIERFTELLDESFVPFQVDIVTTAKLNGGFGERVHAEAQRWM